MSSVLDMLSLRFRGSATAMGSKRPGEKTGVQRQVRTEHVGQSLVATMQVCCSNLPSREPATRNVAGRQPSLLHLQRNAGLPLPPSPQAASA